jgi:alpha-N-acetylglucosaminidase
MLNFKYQLLFLLLTFSFPVALSNHKAIESLLHRLDSKRAISSVQEAAAKGVLKRLLPTHLSSFEFNIVSKVVVVALFLF